MARAMKKLVIAALLFVGACVAMKLANVGPMAARAGVTGAWVRLPAVPGRPAAGYFTADLSGNRETLRAAASPAAARIEFHRTGQHGGMAHMTPMREVDSERASVFVFAPGGNHLMIYGLDPALKPGATIPLTLTFIKAGSVTVQATLVGAADPAP